MSSQVDFCLFNYLSVDEYTWHDTLFFFSFPFFNFLIFLFKTVSILKRPRTPPATPGIVDYQSTDHEQLMKRLRPAQSVEEVILKIFSFLFVMLESHLSFCLSATKPQLVINLGIAFLCSIFQVTYPTPRQQALWSLEDLPRTVAITMHQGSTVTSMDFHPSHHTLLLGKKFHPGPYCGYVTAFITKRLQFYFFFPLLTLSLLNSWF